MVSRWSFEEYKEATDNHIGLLEKALELYRYAEGFTETLLNQSKNFGISFCTVLDASPYYTETTVCFHYLEAYNFRVVFSIRPENYIFNVTATDKNSYDVNDFRVETDDMMEAIHEIVKFAEGK